MLTESKPLFKVGDMVIVDHRLTHDEYATVTEVLEGCRLVGHLYKVRFLRPESAGVTELHFREDALKHSEGDPE